MKLHSRYLEAASFGPRKQLCLHGGRIKLPCFLHRSLLRSPGSWLGTDPVTWQPGLAWPRQSPGSVQQQGGPGLSLLPSSMVSLSNSNANAAIFLQTLKINPCHCLFFTGCWRDPVQDKHALAVGASCVLPISGQRSAEVSNHHVHLPWGSPVQTSTDCCYLTCTRAHSGRISVFC